MAKLNLQAIQVRESMRRLAKLGQQIADLPRRAKERRVPVAYFYFNGFDNLSLGISIGLKMPNIEIHVPFGFFRIGLGDRVKPGTYVIGFEYCERRTFGLRQRYTNLDRDGLGNATVGKQ